MEKDLEKLISEIKSDKDVRLNDNNEDLEVVDAEIVPERTQRVPEPLRIMSPYLSQRSKAYEDFKALERVANKFMSQMSASNNGAIGKLRYYILSAIKGDYHVDIQKAFESECRKAEGMLLKVKEAIAMIDTNSVKYIEEYYAKVLKEQSINTEQNLKSSTLIDKLIRYERELEESMPKEPEKFKERYEIKMLKRKIAKQRREAQIAESVSYIKHGFYITQEKKLAMLEETLGVVRRFCYIVNTNTDLALEKVRTLIPIYNTVMECGRRGMDVDEYLRKLITQYYAIEGIIVQTIPPLVYRMSEIKDAKKNLDEENILYEQVTRSTKSMMMEVSRNSRIKQ
ncbi:MAG: hypothetical protein QXK37_02715 [Candidatus Woesearchaeota archaeon]